MLHRAGMTPPASSANRRQGLHVEMRGKVGRKRVECFLHHRLVICRAAGAAQPGKPSGALAIISEEPMHIAAPDPIVG